jgi:uncharacterized protein YndB with AHSA1/START domain
MPDILHRLSIDAPPVRVRDELATTRGIEQWWTGHPVKGDPTAGGTLQFFFGGSDPAAVVEVVENTTERIVWRVVDGPRDWLDTQITFVLRPSDAGATTLLFTHGGWREQNEFMANCSSEWASYLIGLRAGLDGRAYTPFPAGNVSRWS